MRSWMLATALALVCTACSSVEPDAILSVRCGHTEYDPAIGAQRFVPGSRMTVEVYDGDRDAYEAIVGVAHYGNRRLCTFDLEYTRTGSASSALAGVDR